jgi:hypothetical protein
MFVGGDESGRLLRYDPFTGETKVLLHGLKFPNGIAISEDNSYLVMSETLTRRFVSIFSSSLHRHPFFSHLSAWDLKKAHLFAA